MNTYRITYVYMLGLQKIEGTDWVEAKNESMALVAFGGTCGAAYRQRVFNNLVSVTAVLETN